MRIRTVILVIAMVLFAAQWTGAFVRPMYPADTATSSGQQTAGNLTMPYSAASHGAEMELPTAPDSPRGSVPAIPEPSTVLLIGVGLVGTGIARIRKHRR